MESDKSVRDRIIALFTKRLGEPHVANLPQGPIYRWTLERGRHQVSLLITIDSPEWKDMAHVLISDSPTFQIDPVNTVTVYTLEEAETLLDRIETQWKKSAGEVSQARKQQ